MCRGGGPGVAFIRVHSPDGGTRTATLDVYVVDKAGQAIPDCHLTLTKNVQ